jgi:hypothetical protein
LRRKWPRRAIVRFFDLMGRDDMPMERSTATPLQVPQVRGTETRGDMIVATNKEIVLVSDFLREARDPKSNQFTGLSMKNEDRRPT